MNCGGMAGWRVAGLRDGWLNNGWLDQRMEGRMVQ